MATFNKDMIALANGNDFFQKEAFRDDNVQIVLMSLAPGEDIGEETHRADQTTFFVSGEGQAVLDGKSTRVGPNHMVVIPQGTKHNIVNKGTGPLKLFSVYAPPAEEPGVANRTKADAEAAEKGVLAKAGEAVIGAAEAARDAVGGLLPGGEPEPEAKPAKAGKVKADKPKLEKQGKAKAAKPAKGKTASTDDVPKPKRAKKNG